MKRLLLASLLFVSCNYSSVETETNQITTAIATSGEGGTAGDGGAATSGVGGAGGAGGISCYTRDVLTGSDGCYDPLLPGCCDLEGTDLAAHCDAATNGAEPVPLVCTWSSPTNGGPQTDYRVCVPITITSFSCVWGEGLTVICCEPDT